MELAKKSIIPEMTTADLEKWLDDVTAENDEILKKAKDYNDQCPEHDKISQSSLRQPPLAVSPAKLPALKHRKPLVYNRSATT